MKVYTGYYVYASINVTHFDVTIERRIGMKYDVMSGVNFYRKGMESTLSEQHQQIVKNIFHVSKKENTNIEEI
jgi:hypothetical protein